MTAVEQALRDVSGDLRQALDRFKQDAEVVKAWDAILGILAGKKELMRVTTMTPTRVGASPQNRGGLGFEAPRASKSKSLAIR